jgi:hypothetical protein
VSLSGEHPGSIPTRSDTACGSARRAGNARCWSILNWPQISVTALGSGLMTPSRLARNVSSCMTCLQPRPSRAVSGSRERAIYPTEAAFPEWARWHHGLHQAGRAHTLRGQTRRHRWRSGLCTRALLDWGGQETAGVDIFRFDADGKVVEHWDVLQPVPASSNHPNTMF